MVKKRPCRICRSWFTPHPRAGDRQRVCSKPACQRERHRRSCKELRERDADEVRRERLESRLERSEKASGPSQTPIQSRLDWDAVRDAVGLETAVVVELAVKHIDFAVRDAVAAQIRALSGDAHKVPIQGSRDAIGPRARSA